MATPKFELPRGFKAAAERTSINMREAMSLAKHDPLCAFKLAEHLGIPIKSIHDYGIPDDGERYSDWFAMLMYKKSGKPIIIHNKNCNIYRQQSDIMHEISHFHCRHPLSRHPTGFLIPANMLSVDPVHEEEAACLGATLQLPREALTWAIYREKMTLKTISEAYVASMEMVRLRVNMTGLSKEVKRLHLI